MQSGCWVRKHGMHSKLGFMIFYYNTFSQFEVCCKKFYHNVMEEYTSFKERREQNISFYKNSFLI